MAKLIEKPYITGHEFLVYITDAKIKRKDILRNTTVNKNTLDNYINGKNVSISTINALVNSYNKLVTEGATDDASR